MSKSDSDEFEDFAEAGNPGDNRNLSVGNEAGTKQEISHELQQEPNDPAQFHTLSTSKDEFQSTDATPIDNATISKSDHRPVLNSTEGQTNKTTAESSECGGGITANLEETKDSKINENESQPQGADDDEFEWGWAETEDKNTANPENVQPAENNKNEEHAGAASDDGFEFENVAVKLEEESSPEIQVKNKADEEESDEFEFNDYETVQKQKEDVQTGKEGECEESLAGGSHEENIAIQKERLVNNVQHAWNVFGIKSRSSLNFPSVESAIEHKVDLSEYEKKKQASIDKAARGEEVLLSYNANKQTIFIQKELSHLIDYVIEHPKKVSDREPIKSELRDNFVNHLKDLVQFWKNSKSRRILYKTVMGAPLDEEAEPPDQEINYNNNHETLQVAYGILRKSRANYSLMGLQSNSDTLPGGDISVLKTRASYSDARVLLLPDKSHGQHFEWRSRSTLEGHKAPGKDALSTSPFKIDLINVQNRPSLETTPHKSLPTKQMISSPMDLSPGLSKSTSNNRSQTPNSKFS